MHLRAAWDFIPYRRSVFLCADSSDLFSPRQCIISSRSFSPTAMNPFYAVPVTIWTSRRIILNLILSKKVDGIILVGSNFIGTNEEENQYIKDVSAQVPIMLLNASFDYPNVYSTLCDDYTSMFEGQPFPCLTRGLRTFSICTIPDSYSGVKSWAVFAPPWRHTLSRIMRNGVLFYEGDPQQMDDVANYLERLSKRS